MRSLKSALVFLKNPNKDVYDKPGAHFEHLGICYVGAALRQAGFPVTLIDGAAEGLSSEEVLERINLFDADFVGFSVTHATIREALRLSRQLKAEDVGIHICFGGHHATFSARQILENEDCVDSVVRGDGEITSVELLKALQTEQSLEGIQGVFFRDGSGIVRMNTDRSVAPDLNVLPFPVRDVLESIVHRYGSRTASLSSSRGCLYRCKFCSTPEFYDLQGGLSWRCRSAANVVDEIQMVNETYGTTNFIFVDDNSVIPSRKSKDRLSEIAEEILKRQLRITFFVLCGVQVFGPEDSELLSLLKAAGLTRIFLGVEAGYQPTLNMYNKLVSPEENMRGVEFLAEAGFLLLCSTVLFHPYAAVDELRENSRFIKRLMDKPSVGMLAPYCRRLEAYRGIPLFEEIKRDGFLLTDKPYLNAYAYKFVSPVVQLVADTMWHLLPIVVDTDWLIWDARLLLLTAAGKEKCLQCQGFSLDQARRKVQQTIEEINRINFDFFNLALDLADRGDQPTLDRERTEYAPRLKAQGALLRQEYESLARNLACLHDH